MNHSHSVYSFRLAGAALALTLAASPAFFSGAHVQAQEAAAQQNQQQQKFGETIVTADQIDYDLGKKQVIASGNVDLVSGESHLTAEKMTVQMAANKGLDWARCEGKVVVEKKNAEENTSMRATGQTLNYSETEQKASLEGDVVAHLSSPRLAKPATITGAKVDMDLKTQKNVVVRSPGAQAKVHVEPKGQEGKPTPEPLDLMADRIEMNGQTQEYIASGKPVLVRPTSKLQAKRIRFTVEDDAKDVKVAYAEQNVVFDGQGENGSVIHTTADNGVFTREINELVLSGAVVATIKDPEEERPTVYQGSKFTYNTKTRASRLSGSAAAGTPARIVVPGGKFQGGTPEKSEKAPAAAGSDKK